MDKFTASNGVEVSPRATGAEVIITGDMRALHISAEKTAALREFFRAEEDDRLGRWRHKELVVYPEFGTDAVLVLSEKFGEAQRYTEDQARAGGWGSAAAVAYFDTHAVSKPWHAAVEGEVWIITYDGSQYPAIFQAERFRDHGGSWAAGDITDAHRIWPEES